MAPGWWRWSSGCARASSRCSGSPPIASTFDLPATKVGRQSHDLAGAELWVLPNPSGLNAHETLASLAAAYREAAVAAGVVN